MKDCPFCGGKVQYLRDLETPKISGIFCRGCKAMVKWPIQMSSKEAFGENESKWLAKWDRRAAP